MVDSRFFGYGKTDSRREPTGCTQCSFGVSHGIIFSPNGLRSENHLRRLSFDFVKPCGKPQWSPMSIRGQHQLSLLFHRRMLDTWVISSSPLDAQFHVNPRPRSNQKSHPTTTTICPPPSAPDCPPPSAPPPPHPHPHPTPTPTPPTPPHPTSAFAHPLIQRRSSRSTRGETKKNPAGRQAARYRELLPDAVKLPGLAGELHSPGGRLLDPQATGAERSGAAEPPGLPTSATGGLCVCAFVGGEGGEGGSLFLF